MKEQQHGDLEFENERTERWPRLRSHPLRLFRRRADHPLVQGDLEVEAGWLLPGMRVPGDAKIAVWAFGALTFSGLSPGSGL